MKGELFDYSKIRDLAKILQKKRVHTKKCLQAVHAVMPTHVFNIKWSEATESTPSKIIRCAIVQRNGIEVFFAGSPAKLGRIVLFQALLWRREKGFMSADELRQLKKGVHLVDLLRKRYAGK